MSDPLRKKRVISDEDENMEDSPAEPLFIERPAGGAMADGANSVDKPHENGETATKNKGEENDKGEEENDGKELWEVESITLHKGRKGAIKYWVKWIGFSSDENTWEPHSNMIEDAPEAVDEYWKNLSGGKELYAKLFGTTEKGSNAADGKRRKTAHSPSSSGAQKSNRNSAENKLTNVDINEEQDADEEDQAVVKDGSWPIEGLDWEKDVREVVTMDRNEKNELVVYLTWNNNKRTVHLASEVNSNCPQKIIKFYENHLRFKTVS